MKRITRLVLYIASAMSLVAITSSQNTNACTEQERLVAADCNNCPRGNGMDCNCTRASPPNLAVSNIADRSASLTWRDVEITSFIGYSIIYYFVGGEREVMCISNRMTTTAVLTTLRPFTTYFAHIRPKCGNGYGLCSSPVTSFTTAGAAPSGRPQNVIVRKVSGSIQYQVSWNLPPNDTWNGPLLQHRITIINQTDNSMILFNVTAGNTVFVLSMLDPGDYLVRVRAYNSFGQGPDSETEVFSILRDDIDSSDEFDFWGSNYRYLIIPVIIVIAVLFVAVMLFIKWKYYPSTVLYCKDIVEKHHNHVYADQPSPTAAATEFSFTSPLPHTQLHTQSVSSNSDETAHSVANSLTQRVLNVSPPNHRTPERSNQRDILSPNDSDSVFGPYAEVGLQKQCSPGVKYPPIPNMSRHPSLWPQKRNRMGIGRANSTAGDTPTLPAHAAERSITSQPSPYEVPHSVTDAAETLTISDPSINLDDFSPPSYMPSIPPPLPPMLSASRATITSPHSMRAQNSVLSMQSATSFVPPKSAPLPRHHETQAMEMQPMQGSPRVLGQPNVSQSQSSIPPLPVHSPPPLTKSSLDLVARLEKGHESIEDLMETIEQEEREAGMAATVAFTGQQNGPRLMTSASHTAVPYYSEPFDTTKKPPNDLDPSWLQPGCRNSNSLPRFTRMNSVPDYLVDDKRHHKVSVPSNVMMAGVTPPIYPRSNINRFPSTRSEQPLPYLKEHHHNQSHLKARDPAEPLQYVPPSSVSDFR